MMDRSGRFISLSGWSGISSGVVALIGAYLAYSTIYAGQSYMQHRYAIITWDKLMLLLLIAAGTLLVSVGLAYYFTHREVSKKGGSMWSPSGRQLLISLLIPLIAGGVLCLLLLSKGLVGLVAPLTLIFYGLALVNASNYTLRELRSLGILEIILGLLSTYFIGYGLIFWVVGFGLLHILYGIFMQIKYS